MQARRTWDRLKRRADFLRIAGGSRRVAPGFILQAAGGENPDMIRVGFTVSRKVGNAVARNRAKRRLRALVDNVMAEAGRPGMDYVLIGRGETLVRDFAVMERELRTALEKVVVKTTPHVAAKAETA